MRIDGRSAHEMRPVEIVTGYQEHADGSALVSLGKTRVLCAATIEDRVPQWVTSAGWLTAQYRMLPRATVIRTPRNGSARETEIEQLIGRALRASLDLQALGPRTIIIDCDVVQADGGTRTAAITGAYVALALAVGQLVLRAQVPAQTLRTAVAATSVALANGEMLLDPSHAEDIQADVDCDVVMNAEGRLVEVHAPAATSFSREQLDRMLDLAAPPIEHLLDLQRRALAQERIEEEYHARPSE